MDMGFGIPFFSKNEGGMALKGILNVFRGLLVALTV